MDAEIFAEHEAHAGDGGAKRRQIIDGARTVFLSDGFDGASMNDIAHVAGVSKGTLYAYFDSKEQLFEALVREDRASAGRAAVRASLTISADPRALLGAFGRRLVEMMIRPDTVAHARVVIAAAAKFPRLGRAFYEAGPRYGVQKLAERLDAFRQVGRARNRRHRNRRRASSSTCAAATSTSGCFSASSIRAAERDRRRCRRRGGHVPESLRPVRARSPRSPAETASPLALPSRRAPI